MQPHPLTYTFHTLKLCQLLTAHTFHTLKGNAGEGECGDIVLLKALLALVKVVQYGRPIISNQPIVHQHQLSTAQRPPLHHEEQDVQ